jgi:type II secretory pathway pseudopilin PulG
MVLLEVIVALTILAVGATTIVALAASSLDAVSRAEAADAETRHASALLEAVSLWPRADLDRHLGDRPEGPWDLRIDRPSPTLYTVALSDTAIHVLLVRTSLYRAEVPDAP